MSTFEDPQVGLRVQVMEAVVDGFRVRVRRDQFTPAPTPSVDARPDDETRCLDVPPEGSL